MITEVLEGCAPGESGTYFVQGGEALRSTLKNLTAEEASCQIAPNVNSIAAHLIHTNYYLWFSLEYMHGRTPTADWAQSWAKQTVTEEEFQEEQAKLISQVELFCMLLDDKDLGEQENIFGAIANVGHIAYHLGAIRQLFLLVKPQNS